MNQGLIQTRKQETVGYIEINRPEKANAYNQELLDELASSLDQMETDRDINTLVISGAGTSSFCAGADLDEMQKMPLILKLPWLQSMVLLLQVD